MTAKSKKPQCPRCGNTTFHCRRAQLQAPEEVVCTACGWHNAEDKEAAKIIDDTFRKRDARVLKEKLIKRRR